MMTPTKKKDKQEQTKGPSTQNSNFPPANEFSVRSSSSRATFKYPLPGVPTLRFRALFSYNLAHDVASEVFTAMMSWITYKDIDEEFQKNPFKPLLRTFFQEPT